MNPNEPDKQPADDALADLEAQAEAAVAAASAELSDAERAVIDAELAECNRAAERHNRMHAEQNGVIRRLIDQAAALQSRVAALERGASARNRELN